MSIGVFSIVRGTTPLGTYLKDGIRLNDLTSDAYMIDKNSGMLTLNEDHPSVKLMNDILQANKEEYGDDAYIVLEIKVEKYRSLDDVGDLPSEHVDAISTMQLIHSRLLEYCYQYTMAKQTQERLDEIAYTTYITVTSTIIVLGVTAGVGAALSSVGSASLAPIAKSLNLLALFKAAQTVFSEVLEELYIDPWIEAYFSHKTKEWGWEIMGQVFFTTFMESFRETAMSGVADAMRASASQAFNMLSSTNQDMMMDMQENTATLKVQQSQGVEIASFALSTFMLFAGAIMPGFASSSLITGLATTFTVVGTIGDDMGDAIASFLQKDSSQRGIAGRQGLLARLREDMTNRRAIDPRGKPFNLLDKENPAPKEVTVKKIEDMTRSDLSLLQRAQNWLSEHKAGVVGVVGGLVGLGLVNIFPIVGSILSSLSLPFTVGMVNSESRLLGNSKENSIKERINDLINRLQELSQTLQEKSEAIIQDKNNNPLLENEVTNVYYYFDKFGIERPSNLVFMKASGGELGVIAHDINTIFDYRFGITNFFEGITGDRNYWSNSKNGFINRFQKANDIEKLNLILEVMYQIHKIDNTIARSLGLDLNKIEMQKQQVKEKLTDLIIEQGLIHENSKEMFNLYSKVCLLISEAENKFFDFHSLNELIWTLGEPQQGGIYRIEGKLINTNGIYEIDSREYFCLRTIVMRYKNINELFVRILNAELDTYYLNNQHPVTKRIPNRGTRVLDRHYDELHLALIYTLLLEQAGFDAKTLRPLDDLDFSIHHLYEMSELILVELLSLHSEVTHSNIINIDNLRKFGEEQEIILYNRKIIKELIEIDRKITKDDLSEEFISHFKFKKDIIPFVNRINYLKTHSEKEFFSTFFEEFYTINMNKRFWHTHYLGDYNKIYESV